MVLAREWEIGRWEKRSSTFCYVGIEMAEPADWLCVDKEGLLIREKQESKCLLGFLLE